MRDAVFELPWTFVRLFQIRYLPWHIVAIALTAAIALSGLDWQYHVYFRDTVVYTAAFTAGAVGFLVPILTPIVFLVVGFLRSDARMSRAAFAIAHAEFIALLLSYFYKAFTGRAHPTFGDLGTDLTRHFDFGFLDGGVFWGWPSSHTLVAVAGALTLAALYPKSRAIRFAAIIYAIYIAIGVSMTFHWLSDAVASVILGIVVSSVVAEKFAPGHLTKG